MRKLIPVALIIVIVLIAFAFTTYQKKFGNTNFFPEDTLETVTGTSNPERIETYATGLEVPWEIAFLPNNDALLTERTGKLKLVSGGQVSTVAQIPDVKVHGEGGLMGLTVHPKYDSNNYIYIMYTYGGSDDETLNRVVRYKYSDNKLSDRRIIIDNIPGAIFHNGGRLKFGPDNYLYVTTGDSLKPSLSQDTNSLAGKILRVKDDGKAAPGNPFNNLVYSYGHRNPQGLAWDSQGRLWETEHGNNATDEINIIVRGNNYGWPTITGTQTRTGMQTPFAQSGSETWAPGGAEIVDDTLYFGGLRGAALFSFKVNEDIASLKRNLADEYGRIRAVTKDADDLLYISTSNRDGRGDPNSQDDRILKIDPSQL